MNHDSNQAQFLLVRSIFEQLCDEPAEIQAALLDNLCGRDANLRNQVRQLIELDRENTNPVDLGSIRFSTINQSEPMEHTSSMPDTIGEYTIVGILGHGGSSIVYEAKQKKPDRSVALKVINTRYIDEETIRRFEKEAQIMGNISHPYIAKIFHSGTVKNKYGTDHYIAMELIRGVDLIQYAQSNLNTINNKIRLFLDVCNAMAYAHEQGVIHRDLKPGNILVDTDGHVKILDFGIARVTNQDSDMTTMHTKADRLIGTLAFMSPEQLKGHAHELDERSDVYALGVVLFRMLTNKLPYNFDNLSFYQAAKQIEVSNPARLGTINTRLQGDLDTILAKTLDRDPERRYASVHDLQDDLNRYLGNKPIHARPASALYHVRQFIRRHKGFSAGVGAAMLTLIGGLISISIALSTTVKSEQLAVEKSEISDAITSFLIQDLIGQADTRTSTNRELTVAQALDLAASKIDERFESKPIIEAEIRRMIGRTYVSLAKFAQAQPHLERSLDIYTNMLGANDLETLQTLEELGVLFTKSGANQRSLDIYKTLLERCESVLGPEAPLTLQATNGLALLYTNTGKYEQAKSLHEQTLNARLKIFGENNFATLVSMHNLALVYLYLNQPEKAAELYNLVVPRRTRLLGQDHQATLLSTNNLAGAYQDLGQIEQAIELYNRVLESQIRTLGQTHPDTLRTMANTGSGLLRSSPERALPFLEQAHAGRLEVFGPDNANTLHSRYLIAYAKFKLGEHESSLAELHSIYQDQLRILGSSHRDTKTTLDTMTKFQKKLD